MVDGLLARWRSKAKSLVVTVYGDAIAHRSGNAGLGAAVDLLRPAAASAETHGAHLGDTRPGARSWLQAQAIGRRESGTTASPRRPALALRGRMAGCCTTRRSRRGTGEWTIVAAGADASAGQRRERLLRGHRLALRAGHWPTR